MSPFHMILLGWAVMSVVMVILYFIQRSTSDAGIVDAGWAAGVGALGVFYAIFADGMVLNRVLIAILAGIWGTRLSVYLLVNRVLKGNEDGRYQMLREKWGDKNQLYFFIFFQVQAFWSVLFAIPFLPCVYVKEPPSLVFPIIAILIWLIAVIGESMADWQLAGFRADVNNRGKTCRIGLWKYSRHPNYFFEWIHWFAYVFLAIGSSYIWVAFSGPVIMLLFLYKITGIPYTEKCALASRGEDYRQYQRTTSAFIPWIPKKE